MAVHAYGGSGWKAIPRRSRAAHSAFADVSPVTICYDAQLSVPQWPDALSSQVRRPRYPPREISHPVIFHVNERRLEDAVARLLGEAPQGTRTAGEVACGGHSLGLETIQRRESDIPLSRLSHTCCCF